MILACFGWLFLVSGVDRLSSQSVYKWAFIVRSLNFRGSLDSPEDIRGSGPLLAQVKTWLFAVVIFLGSMEKLSGVANTISMERDWIPALVAKSPGGESSPTQLTQLNAVMRRIDLVCKLVGPVVISVIISLTSTRIGVFTIAALNTLTWGIEMWSARRVWDAYPQLRQRSVGHFVEEIEMSSMDSQPSFQPSAFNVDAAQWCTSQWVQVRGYFLTDVWIPSLSLALLHVSVLTYNATLITYLLNTGFSLILITITRSLSSILEVSSTFVAPISVEYLGRSQKESPPLDGAEALLLEHDLRDQKHGVGLERSGLWAVCSQLINLVRNLQMLCAVIALTDSVRYLLSSQFGRFLLRVLIPHLCFSCRHLSLASPASPYLPSSPSHDSDFGHSISSLKNSPRLVCPLKHALPLRARRWLLSLFSN